MLIEIVIENEFCPFSCTANLHYEKFSDGSITCIEDIIPFTLPNGWRWSRLSSLCSDIQYGVSNSAENSGSHRLLRITDIQDGKVEWDKVPFTTLQSPEQYRLMTGDIVFARTGATVGKSFLIKELPFDSVYASYLIRIRLIGKLSRDYVYDFFNSKCYWNQITDKSVGVGQPNCNGSSLKELLIPVPPINEQELIIKSIKNLQLYSNIIESQQTDLKSLLLKCKSKILDLAIRGKLVSQDPNDEPASKLLERIRHEKEELIKAGKLKRDKRESVIFRGEDNSYYEKFSDGSITLIKNKNIVDIPKSWTWVRFENIIELISGQDLSKDSYNANGEGIPYITGASNIDCGKVIINRWTKTPKSIALAGDLLLTCKGTVGHIATLREEKVHIARQIMAIRSSYGVNKSYIQLFLRSYVTQLKSSVNGIIPGIAREDVLRIPFPLPPLEEQNRIVSTIQKIMNVLNYMETFLT